MTMLDPHLDVDQLSAAVDGLQDEATSDHLATCLACQEQVEVWRRSLRQLSELATVEAPAPDDAIAAALAAWDATPGAPVTPITAARTARRRWRPSGQLVAAVAAVIIVFGGVVSLAKYGGAGSSSSKSSSAGSFSSGQSNGASVSASGESGSSSSGTRVQAGPSAVRGSKNAAATTPITTTRRAVLSADLKQYTASRAKQKVPASTPCLEEAKAAALKDAAAVVGGPATPSYLVPVTYRGVATRAFIFARDSGYIAFVLRDGSCALVASLDF